MKPLTAGAAAALRRPLAVVLALVALSVGLCIGLCAWLWPEALSEGDHWGATLLKPEAWLAQFERWQQWQDREPWWAASAFVLLFALFSALSIPGCAPLALLAGTSFGLVGGTLLVGLASTLGALGPFLAARHVARDAVQRHLGHRLAALDEHVVRHGRLWLFWLRMVPLVPYPLLNPLLGLSRLSVGGFLWPSLAGLTLASLPYVAAGLSMGETWRGGATPKAALWLAVAAASALSLLAWRRYAAARMGPAGSGLTAAAAAASEPPR